MVFELCYTSTETQKFATEDLKQLLTQSRETNKSLNITGMLLYGNGGQFIQVLEGKKHLVRALYEKIERDPRHKNVKLLSELYILGCNFKRWSMAFQQTDFAQDYLNKIEGYSRFLSDETEIESLHGVGAKLLNEFKQTRD